MYRFNFTSVPTVFRFMRDVNNKMSDAVAGVTASQDDYDYSVSLKHFILTQLKPSTIALGDEIDLSSILGEDWFDCNAETADTNDNVAALPETTTPNPPTTQRKWGRKRMLDTTCSICQKQFRNGSLLNRHLQKHYSQHKCPKCAKVQKDPYEAVAEYVRHLYNTFILLLGIF